MLQVKNFYTFHIPTHNTVVKFDGNFDSGNVGIVKQINQQSYLITPNNDCAGKSVQSRTRSWFFFAVKGVAANKKITFRLTKINILWSFVGETKLQSYRPCYKKEQQNWKKMENPAEVYINNNNQVQVKFQCLFSSPDQQIRFAFTFPYQYHRSINTINTIYQNFQNDSQIYLHKEILIQSLQKRDIHLLTISDRQSLLKQKQQKIEGLFLQQQQRSLKDKKPVVLITARVHAGQTPSSYAVESIINCLLNKNDLRSFLLRKYFTFKIIPMLNPDGVYNGNYRMDTENHNLNRYYNTCKISKHPSIYAVRCLMEKYAKENRLMFYFDLHAHPARKGCFMYGNSLTDFVQQVESQIFCKLMEINSKYFEYGCCNFSKKHMIHKDRNDQLSKEGSGRVFAHRISGIIHSYTLELGYHFMNSQNSVPQISNKNFKFKNLAYNSILKKCEQKYFVPNTFFHLGQALMVSILDTIERNPYSRLPNSQFCSIGNLRRLAAFQVFHEDERFRMFEAHTYRKVKQINLLAEEMFYSKIQKYFDMKDLILQNQTWPQCFRINPCVDTNNTTLHQLQRTKNQFRLQRLKRRLTTQQKHFSVKIQNSPRSQNSEDSSQEQRSPPLVKRMVKISNLITEVYPKSIRHINLELQKNIFQCSQSNKKRTIGWQKFRHSKNQEEIIKELRKQLINIKEESKDEYSRGLKQQITETLGKNSFVRKYIQNLKQQQILKIRKNRFYPVAQQDLTICALKPPKEQRLDNKQTQSRLSVRLPTIK